MAVTIPGEWTLQLERQLGPGGRVMDDTNHDLETLNQLTNRVIAQNRCQVLAAGGDQGFLIPETAAMTLRYTCVIKPRRAHICARLHVRGSNVIVEARINGVTICTTTVFGVDVWEVSSTTDTFHTLGSNGEVTLEIYARQRIAVGPRSWGPWILEDMGYSAAYMPQGDGLFPAQVLDDTRFTHGLPLSGHVIGTLRRNAREAQRWRTRGTAVVHPVSAPYVVSSHAWRLDGPYILVTEPWVDQLEVAVRASNPSGEDVHIAPIVEADLRGGRGLMPLIESRQQTLSAISGYTNLVWDGLPALRGDNTHTPNRVWIAYRSEVDITSAGDAPAHAVLPMSEADGTVYLGGTGLLTGVIISDPAGWVVVAEDVDTRYSSGEKGALSVTGPGRQVYDLATVRHSDRLSCYLSPSPRIEGHGLPRQEPGTPAQLYRHACGWASIGGVWINGASSRFVDTEEWHALCAVGQPPPGIGIRRAVREVNELATWGTSQIATRHRGYRWRSNTSTSATGGVWFRRGRYEFADLSNDGAWRGIAHWYVPASPLSGSSANGRIEVAELRAAADWWPFIANWTGRFAPDSPVKFEWRLVAGTASGDEIPQTIVVPHYQKPDSTTVTEYDAARSAYADARDTVPATDEVYHHAYTQQSAWLADLERHGVSLYHQSPVVSCGLPSTYPAVVELQVRLSPVPFSFIVLQAVCAGAWLAYGPRVP